VVPIALAAFLFFSFLKIIENSKIYIINCS
jgi:hypothetical protein